jgi:hypothetical protein
MISFDTGLGAFRYRAAARHPQARLHPPACLFVYPLFPSEYRRDVL